MGTIAGAPARGSRDWIGEALVRRARRGARMREVRILVGLLLRDLVVDLVDRFLSNP